jgi:hypothetical protein
MDFYRCCYQPVEAQLQNPNCARSQIIGAAFPTQDAPVSRLRAKRLRKVSDGPPPEKRSPTLAGNKRRANRKSKFVSRKDNTESAQKSQEIERHFFWITHGQTNAGLVEQIGESYKAIAADERAPGPFATLLMR